MDYRKHIIVWATCFIAVLLGAGLGAGMAGAQENNRRNLVVTPLERPLAQNLRQWLLSRSEPGTTPPPIEFKVPAEISTQVVCRMSSSGLRCIPDVSTMRCPTAVDIEIPGGGRTTVPVSCTGPDNDGNCECDFVQG